VPSIFISLQTLGIVVFNAILYSNENFLTALADKPDYMSDALYN
jgi:hypothetical protein